MQPDSETNLWEKISTTCDLVVERVYRVDGRHLVTRRDLRRIWNCTDEAIKSYVKKGMPKSELSITSMSIYDLEVVRAWRDTNVDSKRGRAVSKTKRDLEQGIEPDVPSSEGGGYAVRQMIAESDKAVENAILAKLKRQELEGSLVESETLDIALAELAVIYVTTYVNDKKLLPIQLKNKSDGDIRKFLDQHYANRISDLDRLITKTFDCEETMYDIIQAVLTSLANDKTPRGVIEALS